MAVHGQHQQPEASRLPIWKRLKLVIARDLLIDLLLDESRQDDLEGFEPIVEGSPAGAASPVLFDEEGFVPFEEGDLRDGPDDDAGPDVFEPIEAPPVPEPPREDPPAPLPEVPPVPVAGETLPQASDERLVAINKRARDPLLRAHHS